MRTLLSVSVLTGFIAVATAADPPLPKSADQPMMLMAKATKSDKGIILHVRTMEMTPATRNITVKVPVQIQKVVNNQVVNETQLQDQQRQITVNQPVRWRTVEVPVDGKEVTAFDLKGQPVDAQKLADQLKDEKPVLASPYTPIDPYFLQAVKDDTLLVRIPAHMLLGQPPQNVSTRR